jgi:hypothetical protein
MKSAVITGYASSEDIPDVSGFITGGQVNTNVTSISGGVITTGIIRNSTQSGPSDGSNFSTSGMAVNLDNGTITSKQFRINSSGDAFFLGTLSSGISISAPSITGGTIGGASITVSDSFTSSGLTTASDSDLSESNDSTTGGATFVVPGSTSFSPTVTIANGKISSNTMLRLESAEASGYTEILAGGTQSAIFSNTNSSLKFTGSLYLGNPANSSSANMQNHTAPSITVDARMRLRVGAPLTYPNGSAGAYIRNIYIKSTTNNPAPTTGHVGDIFMTY